jgi:broad specificity phosphatase PhoE
MGGRIILARHGETEANRMQRFAESDDVPLSPAGRAQAAELARQIARDFHPGLLFSSTLLRARQTGAILGGILNLKAEVLSGIHERDFGTLKGQPYERMGDAMLSDPCYDAHRPWAWRPPGGESLHDVRLRSVSSLRKLLSCYPEGEIAIISHGAVIQAICAHVTGKWRESDVPANCGILVIGFTGNRWEPAK